MTHFLYRHFSKDGTLLYIGITNSPFVRLKSHKNSSHWAPEIFRIEIALFDSRAEAAAAERQAIIDENPRYNVTHMQAAQTNALCRLLKDWMEVNNLIPSQAAERLKVEPRTVQRWLKGDRKPPTWLGVVISAK